MNITAFHAKYFAYELTKCYASDSVEKLVSVLADAQVDSESASSGGCALCIPQPFLEGAILADEVGLGKTIEAGYCLPRNGPSATPVAGHRASQPAQAVGPGAGRQILIFPPSSWRPAALTRRSAPAISIPFSRTCIISVPTNSPAPRSPTCGRHPGTWWSSTKRTGCAMSTSTPTRSLLPSSKPSPRSPRCCSQPHRCKTRFWNSTVWSALWTILRLAT